MRCGRLNAMDIPEGRRRAREMQFDDFFLSEGVAVEVQTANIGMRIASALIDLIAIFATLIVSLTAWFKIYGFLDDAMFGAGLTVITVLTTFVSPFLLEVALDGRTLGKLALGIRVVRSDHGALTPRHCAIRALVRVVEISFFSGVPSLICMFATRRTQRLGDLAAGTMVIRDRVRLPTPVTPLVPAHLAPWATQADLAVLPADLSLRIRSFLARTSTLHPQSLERQAQLLAREAAAYVMPQPPPGTAALVFLQAIMAERFRRDHERLLRLQAASDKVLPSLSRS